MGLEIGPEESLTINARTFLAGYAGMSAMLSDFLSAHDALKARGGDSRPAYTPVLETAYDVMTVVYQAVKRVVGPCNAALDADAYDPRLSIAVTDSLATLSDLLERVSARVELPINQWLTEITADHVHRDDWPGVWQVSVWTGAVLHYVEDAAVVLQAYLQFLSDGQVFETRRAGAEWLNQHGALAALDAYRRAEPRQRATLREEVSHVCAHALHALGEASKRRAERAAAVAGSVAAARHLDARDIVHLGIHSQAAVRGGVFLSHRGQDAKRPLMDFHRTARPEIFLDVWARPAGDTNRRFLWRNLAAASEMHAFVTENYAASHFCLKEIEAWGLLSIARGDAASDPPGRFFVIDGAETGLTDAGLCAWASQRREDTSLEHAIRASASSLDENSVIGSRSIHGDEEREASDEFNRALLTSGLFGGAEAHVIQLWREPIQALVNLLGEGLALVSRGDGLPRAAAEAVAATLPRELPANGAAFVSTLHTIAARLRGALASSQASPPVVRCVLFALTAVTEMSAHVVRHWDGGSSEAIGRGLIGFSKFGGTIDKVNEQLANWCVALATAGFAAHEEEELLAGLLLGLLPIDHEAADRGVRLDSRFSLPQAATVAQAFEAAGLARRTVQVVCSPTPTVYQRMAVIGALSSFTSRSFLFVDVAGSGALRARVGFLAMEEFPHVTVARIEDLPAP